MNTQLQAQYQALVDKYHPYQQPTYKNEMYTTENLESIRDMYRQLAIDAAEKENPSKDELRNIYIYRAAKEALYCEPHIATMIDLETFWEFTRRYNNNVNEITKQISLLMQATQPQEEK